MNTALVLVRSAPLVSRSEDLLAEWAADLRVKGRARHTIKAYVGDLRLFARFLGGRPLETATLPDMNAYGRNHLERVTTATWARHANAIRSYFDWYRRREGRAVSAAADLEVPRHPRPHHRWWTTVEVSRFRRAFRDGEPARLLNAQPRANASRRFAKQSDPQVTVLRDRAIAELGLMGLRVSEVTGLDRGDLLDFNRPERAAIVIRRKGGREQVLPLVRDAYRAMRRWMRVRPDVPTPALFVRLPFHAAQPRLHYSSLGLIVAAYARRAGLSLPGGKKFHHLRHTAGQQMSELGMNIEVAQTWLGHASPTTTMIYYAVSDARLRKTARHFTYGGE